MRAAATAYPAPHGLAHGGLVVSRWEQTTPRRRRVYELTRDGELARTAGQGEWRGFVSGMQAVSGGMWAVIGPVAGQAMA